MSRAKAVFIPPAELVVVARSSYPIENPNLFSIGDGFGFFVFFGKQNESLASIEKYPSLYHKKAEHLFFHRCSASLNPFWGICF
ncbi:MAG: hypothetical protein ACLR7P_06050 [Faecalibacterium sp.]